MSTNNVDFETAGISGTLPFPTHSCAPIFRFVTSESPPKIARYVKFIAVSYPNGKNGAGLNSIKVLTDVTPKIIENNGRLHHGEIDSYYYAERIFDDVCEKVIENGKFLQERG